MEYLARPPAASGNASLQEHLSTTRDYARQLTTHTGQHREVAEVAAQLHDFGKLTEWFQDYIRTVAQTAPDETVSLTRDEQRKKQHARISAYATEYALYKCNIPPEWRTYGFIAVARHHQTLPDISGLITRTTNLDREVNADRFQLVQQQLENIYTTAYDTADTLLAEVTGGTGSLDDFVHYVRAKQTHQTLTKYDLDSTTYGKLVRVWGLLIAADKLSSAGLDIPTVATHSPDCISDHIDDLPDGDTRLEKQLNTYRDRARDSILDNLQTFQQSDTNLATITLPTGFGKTLAGLQAALSLARHRSRVIYALPYTSILDQADVVVQQALGVAPQRGEYTIHHHLAETRTIPDTRPVDTDATELLAESWQAPLVLTTFVQLFESLAGPTNTQSVKLPALEDAVILLDEPQALPERWWRFVTWGINLLTEEFDATVLLMTATQPRLLESIPHADAPFELVDNTQTYFEFLGDHPRIEYRLDDSTQRYLADPQAATPRPIQDAVTEVAASEAQSVLSIGNTVKSVNEQGGRLLEELDDAVSLNKLLDTLYEEIPSAKAFSDRLADELSTRARRQEGPIVGTLTARLRPIDRTILIRVIRDLLETNTPLYVASTQLVEAGVDVSFERVYRDVAPLPSLIQAAGRCNREFGADTAEVVVWRLQQPDEQRATADIIYQSSYNLLAPTREALQTVAPTEGNTISEQTMAQTAGELYFQQLHSDLNPVDRELVRAAQRADFSALSAESLIPQDYPQIDIYIARTPNERQLFDAYTQFATDGAYERLSNLRAALRHRQISVPAKSISPDAESLRLFPGQEHLYYLDATEFGSVYHIQTGGALDL